MIINEDLLKIMGCKMSQKNKYSNCEIIKYKIGSKNVVINALPNKTIITKRAKLKKYLNQIFDNVPVKFYRYPANGIYYLNNKMVELATFEPNLYTGIKYFMYDISNCYPSIFLQLFDVPEKHEIRDIFSKIEKKDRLRLLGGLASHPTIYKWNEKEQAYDLIEKQPERFAFGFWNLVYSLALLNKKMIEKFKNDIKMIYADAIFVNENLHNQFGNEFEIEVNVKEIFNIDKIITLKYKLKEAYELSNIQTKRSLLYSDFKNLNIDEKTYKFTFSNEKKEKKQYIYNTQSTIIFQY